MIFRTGKSFSVECVVMPLHWTGRDVIAQRMADRIGHGMSEKCNLFAEVALEMMVEVYNAGYAAGHHDTVDGSFVNVHDCDKKTYHQYEVDLFVAELSA